MANNDVENITAIATLGLGEAGTAITTGLAEVWRKDHPARRILSVDIGLGDNLRGAAINERARQIGVEIEGSYTSKLADAGAVFCVVTGVEAKNAALAAREVLKPGTLFFDVNTLTGPQTAAIAEEMYKAGIDYVDFAAMGGFATSGHKVPFVVSGPAGERIPETLRFQCRDHERSRGRRVCRQDHPFGHGEGDGGVGRRMHGRGASRRAGGRSA